MDTNRHEMHTSACQVSIVIIVFTGILIVVIMKKEEEERKSKRKRRKKRRHRRRRREELRQLSHGAQSPAPMGKHSISVTATDIASEPPCGCLEATW